VRAFRCADRTPDNSCGVLCGSGMGGLTVFQNSVQQLLTKVSSEQHA